MDRPPADGTVVRRPEDPSHPWHGVAGGRRASAATGQGHQQSARRERVGGRHRGPRYFTRGLKRDSPEKARLAAPGSVLEDHRGGAPEMSIRSLGQATTVRSARSRWDRPEGYGG